MTVEVPLPPPKGHLRRWGHHRMYLSKQYREWRAMVLPLFLAAWNRPPDSQTEWHLHLDIALSPRQRDVHNYADAILDTMQGVVYEDDKQVVALTIRRVDKAAKHPVVRIRLAQAEAAEDLRHPGGGI